MLSCSEGLEGRRAANTSSIASVKVSGLSEKRGSEEVIDSVDVYDTGYPDEVLAEWLCDGRGALEPRAGTVGGILLPRALPTPKEGGGLSKSKEKDPVLKERLEACDSNSSPVLPSMSVMKTSATSPEGKSAGKPLNTDIISTRSPNTTGFFSPEPGTGNTNKVCDLRVRTPSEASLDSHSPTLEC